MIDLIGGMHWVYLDCYFSFVLIQLPNIHECIVACIILLNAENIPSKVFG